MAHCRTNTGQGNRFHGVDSPSPLATRPARADSKTSLTLAAQVDQLMPQDKTPTEPATLLDVARLAGVSASTVSRILNGTARVTEDKRQAVERAIERLQFRPNFA